MEKKYICPTCDGQLMVGENIIFTIRNTSKQKGLLLLHPEIGNYTSIKHRDFKFSHGEKLEFYCPLCGTSLVSDINENLIEIVLIENGKQSNIYFSKIAGEYSTYKVNEDEVSEAGEHADRYTYFKVADKYKPYLNR